MASLHFTPNPPKPHFPNRPNTPPLHPQLISLTNRSSFVAGARKISRTGRFDSRNRRGGATTTKEEEELLEAERDFGVSAGEIDDGFVMPDLPGKDPNFWEGPQWNGLGFFVQYMWAFGIVFAVIACGIAVVTYNEGATDFKQTPAYQESTQSQQLFEEPEASNSDVFEGNPTEEAPSLD
ncbi:hypothetical protein Syun_021695 [Stephania yunnanensis]|uniref:Uncharacterized protein n=1 Tax=Stephania yunnanensis TaxID=152371 RepID=A0AAP0IG83_9MAGN